jgi:dTMP kinase
VLCDRFTDATYAYQSGGSGVAWDKVAALEQWVHATLQPDLTLIFDVSPEIGRQRAQQGKTADRFEREEIAYFRRVRQAYLRRAKADAERVRVIDANGNVASVRKALEALFSTYCPPAG